MVHRACTFVTFSVSCVTPFAAGAALWKRRVAAHGQDENQLTQLENFES
jgi:hypothetical protein